MPKTAGIAIIVIGAAWCVLAAGATPSSQPAGGTASMPSSAPSSQQLEQARSVFRQLQAQLTDGDRIRIEKLISQLGSQEWKDRQAGMEALKKESVAALPLIRKAADGNDKEIAGRAGDIISAIEVQHRDIGKALRGAIATRLAAKDVAVVGDLVALLESDDSSVRWISGRSLSRLTGQDFGYLASAEPDQRTQSAKKAHDWWEKNKAAFVLAVPSGPEDEITLDLGGGVKRELVLIPSGKFMMGSPKNEKDRLDSEGPQHEVSITKPFYMGIYAVTQEQYEAVMGKNPSNFKGPQNPVETVSWDDAAEFCKKLSQKTGRTVHLPTEAQWEYACRAGTKTRFSYGDDDDYGKLGDYSWYAENSENKTHPVGQKKPNDWGLYDMHGNVWQWCADWWEESYANAKDKDPRGPANGSVRVLRGGSWDYIPQRCRSAFRGRISPGARYDNIGFRVSVDLK